MTSVSASPPDGEPVYSFRPSLLGAPWTFRLTPTALSFEAGRKSGRVAYGDINRLRLSFRPISMQTQRFQTEIWAAGAPKLVLISSSWKSMVEQERLDQSYAAFVADLHRRIAAAGSAVRFEQGSNPIRYWPGLAVFTAMSLEMAFLIMRALQSDAPAGAAFIAAFLGLFLWHGGNYFRRNRPGVYAPEALPELLMPKT